MVEVAQDVEERGSHYHLCRLTPAFSGRGNNGGAARSPRSLCGRGPRPLERLVRLLLESIKYHMKS